MNRFHHLIVVGVCGALAACGTAERSATSDNHQVTQTAGDAVGTPAMSAGLTAQAVVDYFVATGLPAPNPRDNSKNCQSVGCTQLITTDAISVYAWPNENAAQHQVDVVAGDAFQHGTIVLSYSAARTPEANRPLYEAALKKVTG